MRVPNAAWLVLLPIACGAACSAAPANPWEKSGGGSTSAGSPGSPGAPGSNSSSTGTTTTDACVGQALPLLAPRVWRLTTPQMKNTLLSVFGYAGTSIDMYPADSRPDTSEYADAADSLIAGDLLTTYYDQTAEEVSANLATRSSTFLGCAMTALGTGSCLQDFLTSYGLKAWRRPLTSTEVTNLQGLYTTVAASAGAQVGFTTVVQALILSPNFLFRTELGTSMTAGTTTALTDYELASALSYMLWDSPPDQALYDAAAAGTLHEQSSLSAQVKRMFAAATPAPAALSSFVQQWLHTDGLLTVTKSPTDFPMWSAAVSQDLASETTSFVSSVAFDPAGDRTLGSLLTASYGFVSAATASLYGVPAPAAAAGLVRTNFDPTQRSGLLTEAAWLAAVSDYDDTDLPARGNFVRGALLCDASPPPPAVFMFDPTVITPTMTGRQKFIAHTKSSTCGACHNLFDGIGFALEQYDPVGRFRTTDQGQTIDPSGSIPLPAPSKATMQFANFIDLMKQMAASPDLGSCYTSQYVRYVTGRTTAEVSDCELQTVASVFNAAGRTVDSLPAAIVALPTFITRQN
jgi:hypothetical protein